jgi:hypothetical protein
MAVTTTKTNKPINPRGDDKSPLAFNRAKIYSGKALDFDGVNDSINLDGFTMSGNTATFSFYADANNDGYFFDINLTRFLISHNEVSGQGIRIFNKDTITTYGNYPRIGILFYTIVCDGTSQSVYINGKQFGSTQTVPALDLSAASSFKIGSNFLLNGSFYDGTMSGFKIFNTALTAAQVLDLYNNPEKIVPTGVDNTALKLWLPMMEGAGTTAYDGSGNGNHGTISGATWTQGVGAPVAQTAVIDWNKGSNFYNDSDWEVSNATTNAFIFSSSQSAPNGIDTAAVFDDGTGSTYKRVYKVSNTAMAIGQITASTFVKKKDVDYINLVLGTDGGTYKFFALVDLVYGTINATSGSLTATSIQSVGDGWYYVSVEASHLSTTQGITYIYGQDPTNGSSVDENYTGANNQTYIWGINIQQGSINNVHLPTIGALQSSPVLLPQGLTSGRDITGVNLFENVRKQYALNLDGQSWAEVHDNESLDITDAITLEAWVYWDTDGATGKGILGRWISGDRTYLLYKGTSQNLAFYINLNSTGINTMATGWHHIVGTYDKSNLRLYVDGSQENSAPLTIAIPTSGRALEIGRHEYSAFKIYDNSIAQPRIYNRALTADEVEQNYNAGKNTYS